MGDPDDMWRLGWETSIKAKSVTGYSTYNRKLTQNRFMEGEGKPELLDDWDQRMVVSILQRGDGGRSITIIQKAIKDQKFNKDSVITYNLDPEDRSILTVTSTLLMEGQEDVVAVRVFRREGG